MIWLASKDSFFASGVGSKRPFSRLKSSISRSRSSDAMRLLTEGCVIPSFSAARAVVCSSITAFKACNCLILIVSHPIQSGIARLFQFYYFKSQIDSNRWFTTVGLSRASDRVKGGGGGTAERG